MKRLAIAVSGLAVVVVVTVGAVVWRASEPPAQGEPRARQPQQQEPQPPPEPCAVVVSGTDPENVVLGEIYARALDRNGFAVEHRWGTGALDGPAEALESGGDVTVGFSNTGAPLGGAPEGIEMLAPARAAKSEHVVVTTRATAERYGLSDVADLAGVPEPVVGSTPTSEEDPLTDLWPRLGEPATEHHTRPAGPGEAIALLTHGDADAVTLDSLEGSIAAEDLVILTDGEKNLVADAPLYPAPVIRAGFADEHPEASMALEEVSRALTTEDVRGLVTETEANGGDPQRPVAAYYERRGSGE